MNNTAAAAVVAVLAADLKNAKAGTFVSSVEANLETAECATRGVVKTWRSGGRGFAEVTFAEIGAERGERVDGDTLFVDAVERACAYLYGFSSPAYTKNVDAAEVACGGIRAKHRRDRA